MEPCQGFCSRFCKISYRTAAAAALTPSDSHPPAQWQRDQLVAYFRYSRAQAATLAAEHQHHARSGVVRRVIGPGRPSRRVRCRTGSVTPAPRLARLCKEVGHVAHARDVQMLDRPGRRLACRRCHLRGTPFGNHHASSHRRTLRCGRSSRGSAGPAPRPAPPPAVRGRPATRGRTRTGSRPPPRTLPDVQPSHNDARYPRPSSP